MAKRDTRKPSKATAAAKRRKKLARELDAVHDSPAIDRRWYASEEKPHDSIAEIVGKLLKDGRRSRAKFYRSLYLDEVRGEQYGHMFPEVCARFNVIRSVCETLHARHGKHQPKPEIHTVGGTWRMQRRAKGMGRYIDGIWEQRKADRMRRDALLDCLVVGEGDIKVYEQQGKVEWARLRMENLLRHPREVKAGHVRTLYEVACVDREVAAATWYEHRDDLLDHAKRAPQDVLDGGDEEDDLVMIVEAWHLPYAQDDNGDWIGGRRCVVADGCTLDDDEWTLPRFPVVELHMLGDTLGRPGAGYPERLAGLQASQNRLAETAEEVARLMPPKYALINGAEPVQGSEDEERWTNLPAEFIRFSGGDVKVLSAEADLMACMQAAAMQRAEMYRIEGIAEDSAQGTVPVNLDSGKAQLVHRDSGAERLIEMAQRVEEFTTDLCRLEIDISEMMGAAGNASRLVAHAGKGQLEEVRFTDVSLGKSPVVVRVAAINKFANSPEGRHKQLLDLFNAQAITLPAFQRLYELTDLETQSMEAQAGYDYAMKLIEAALDAGALGDGTKSVTCPRYCDKAALVDLGWKRVAIVSQEGATDEDLQPLIDLLGFAQSLIDQEIEDQQAKLAAAQPAAPAGPLMPPDAPAPPPAPPAGPIGLVS